MDFTGVFEAFAPHAHRWSDGVERPHDGAVGEELVGVPGPLAGVVVDLAGRQALLRVDGGGEVSVVERSLHSHPADHPGPDLVGGGPHRVDDGTVEDHPLEIRRANHLDQFTQGVVEFEGSGGHRPTVPVVSASRHTHRYDPRREST